MLTCVYSLFIFYLTSPEKSSTQSVGRGLNTSTYPLSGTSVRVRFFTTQLQNIYYVKKASMGICFMAARLLFPKNPCLYKTVKNHLSSTIFSHVFWFIGQKLWSELKLCLPFIIYRSYMNVNIYTPWTFLAHIFNSQVVALLFCVHKNTCKEDTKNVSLYFYSSKFFTRKKCSMF